MIFGGRLSCLVHRHGGVLRISHAVINNHSTFDGKEPGPQRPECGIEASPRTPRPRKRLLDDVFGQRRVVVGGERDVIAFSCASDGAVGDPNSAWSTAIGEYG